MRMYESNFGQATEARQLGSPVLPLTNCLLWTSFLVEKDPDSIAP